MFNENGSWLQYIFSENGCSLQTEVNVNDEENHFELSIITEIVLKSQILW